MSILYLSRRQNKLTPVFPLTIQYKIRVRAEDEIKKTKHKKIDRMNEEQEFPV